MSGSLDLSYVPVRRAPLRRVSQLFAGLTLFGVSTALMVRGGLGLNPWNVLHEALSKRTGLTIGQVTAILGAVLLLCWIPLRERPGLGTVANVMVIGPVADLTLAIVDRPDPLAARIALLVAGVTLNGLAAATYVGVRLGPGPRDGLMTGLSARTRLSIRAVRTGLEVTVLAAGWLLGGTVGVGTVLFALAIGPLTQAFLRVVRWRAPEPDTMAA
jgi:uncharacterized membrane protein YczE